MMTANFYLDPGMTSLTKCNILGRTHLKELSSGLDTMFDMH